MASTAELLTEKGAIEPSGRSPLKICMLAYTFYDTDNRVMRYAESLADRGDQVDVVCLRHPDGKTFEVLHGVNVFRLQKRTVNERNQLSYAFRVLLFLLRSIFFVGRKHLRQPYHVIHVHSVPDFLVFGAMLPKIMGAKVILDIHDLLPEFYSSKFEEQKNSPMFRALLTVERWSARFADHVIIANDIWLGKYVRRSAPANKCSCLLNFPDPDIFAPRGRSRNDDKFVILYPGTLNWHQGVDIAVRAFARIAEQVPKAEFHIYGSGSSSELILGLIKEFGIEDRVFLLPAKPIREIARIMENADLGIVPKRKDSFGNEAFSTKTLEFMSVGVPLIVSDTAIDRYYFNDSVVMFFHDGNEQELADCMLKLATSPAFRNRFARNALEFVRNFSWGTKKREYLDLVDRLVTRPGSTRSKQPVAAL